MASGLSCASSPKFDVFALGVLLYLMLFGVYPFEGKDEKEIIHKIIKEEHKYPPGIEISNTCKYLIDGMLEKNQGLRIELSEPNFEQWYKGGE